MGLRLDITDVRLSELEDRSIETYLQTEMQTEKRMKKMRQYPRTKGQLQKVYHMHNGNIRKRRKRAADKSLK